MLITHGSTFPNWSTFSYDYRDPKTFGPIPCDRGHAELSKLKYVLDTLLGRQETKNLDKQDFDRTLPLRSHDKEMRMA
ncbi:hypothetical protein Y032_0034g2875 [Ancylostoma ceylanicum]|uniref:Uncharacterized protein n=1 Tax=Ancylostoma ceylanicum TaxID=53326 RepID=A0A016UMU2_9BILA|nr:hypothetical protein Y032_0034g2875 [Ancylostoma ceylanicum]